MKKVLFVFHDSVPTSGATASMLDIIDNLINESELYISALIPYTNDGLNELLITKGIPVFQAINYGGRHPVANGILDVIKYKTKGIFKLSITFFSMLNFSKKILNQGDKYDVIYSNTSDTYAGHFLSQLLKVKHIWHVREFGLEDQNCEHTIGNTQYYKWLSMSDKVVVISKALCSKISQHVSNNKLALVYDDVRLTNIKVKSTKILNGPLNILIVGTISEGKGQKLIIDAVNVLNKKGIECFLSIAGRVDSKYAQSMINYVEENKINNISFLGFRDDIEKVRMDHDIGIVASRSEAFGRVTIEGMAAGLIMVVSDAGANPELVCDNDNGYLYKDNNLDALISIISHISENRMQMLSIRENAIKFSHRFDSGLASQKIYNIIKSI
jgi:glycosyltransferase involved in cell wall biosynthesis